MNGKRQSLSKDKPTASRIYSRMRSYKVSRTPTEVGESFERFHKANPISKNKRNSAWVGLFL